MCDLFGTKSAAKKAERSAAEAEAETRAREEKRQADIKTGNTRIDTAFQGFNPAYYDKYSADYRGVQNPQIDQQLGDATGKLTASLAGRGVLDSSIGSNAFGELRRTDNDARARVANDSVSAAGDLKTKVADRKANLYSINQSAADPDGISAQATGSATALGAQPATSPLGQLFASVLAPYATYQQAQQNSPGAPYSYKPSSSYKVVN